MDSNFYKSMKLVNKKHDLINIKITDCFEENFPNIGLLKFYDSETKNSNWIDTSIATNRNSISNAFKNHNTILKKFCKKNNIDIINIYNTENYLTPLIKFFTNRSNKT